MFSVPDLPYAYDALAPAISKEIMELHHSKHHKAYVDKLNAAIEKAPEAKDYSLVELLRHLDQLPDSVRQAVRNNGGGHYNHSLFWQCMTPDFVELADGPLRQAVVAKYGSFDAFVEKFTLAATGLFGSGWVWLTKDLQIQAMPNQDVPIMQGEDEPLMGLDVWEHAYYLDYKNKRDEYIENWWKAVNWGFVEERYKG